MDTEFTKFYRDNYTYNYMLKYSHQMRKMRKPVRFQGKTSRNALCIRANVNLKCLTKKGNINLENTFITGGGNTKRYRDYKIQLCSFCTFKHASAIRHLGIS